MIITRLLEKWFGLEPVECKTCEALRWQLDAITSEKNELLRHIMHPPEPTENRPAPEPIAPRKNIPWSVRQQMLEAEDRAKARLMKEKTDELEKEVLGASDS
jgi:hypothetical protein